MKKLVKKIIFEFLDYDVKLLSESSIYEDIILVYVIPNTKMKRVRVTIIITLDFSSSKMIKLKNSAFYEQTIA